MTTSPASFADPEEVERVAHNVAVVRRRIESAGGDPDRVAIVAVTKGFDARLVRAACAAGLASIGENYVDELQEKRRECHDLALAWHYLGALQSNKIARIVEVADVISGVARDKEITKIASIKEGVTIDVQVDLTGAAQRNGAGIEDAARLVALARAEHLDVRGLMVVASPDPTAAAEQFSRVRELAGELGLRGVSMGMSHDLELAVARGSTEIRVGRALFGPRPASTPLA